MLWGLLAALHATGCELAHFHSVSCLAPHDAARSLTSSASRHLDSWAMSRAGCLRALYRTSQHAELAVVEGDFRVAASPVMPAPALAPASRPASSLGTLCDWLDLPRVAIVDLADLDACRLPPRPERLDALLLDRAHDALHAAWWQTTLEA
ncbi:MAG TPA: hypothetical protein VFV87_20305, partial [Pirellulaceae bacterium]|nr:hypothetical protein [Pirellulaceae bacterium]